MMTRLVGALCAVLVTITLLSSCTPDQVLAGAQKYGVTLTADQAQAVANHVNTRQMSCHAAVDAYWPASAQARAHKVVQRESHGIATAKNKHSTASGCFQMLVIHSKRFARLGYSWSRDRFNAVANVLVARDLYREQGWRPWRLTA